MAVALLLLVASTWSALADQAPLVISLDRDSLDSTHLSVLGELADTARDDPRSSKCSAGEFFDGEQEMCTKCKLFDLLGGRARKRGLGHCRAECDECQRVFSHPKRGQICWNLRSIMYPTELDRSWRRIPLSEANDPIYAAVSNATFPDGLYHPPGAPSCCC